MDVFFAASPASRSRFGVIVPKHGNTIVRRNRLRRRLREIGRVEVLARLDHDDSRLDVLVRARKDAYQVTFPRLKDQLVKIMGELR